jgi:hypothetical protein
MCPATSQPASGVGGTVLGRYRSDSGGLYGLVCRHLRRQALLKFRRQVRVVGDQLLERRFSRDSSQRFVVQKDVEHLPDEVGPVDPSPFEIALIDSQTLPGYHVTLYRLDLVCSRLDEGNFKMGVHRRPF